MTEEINEDNCVLDSFELTMIELACEEYAGRFTLITEKLDAACLKITKLNEMAKQAKDKINHNDYIRHDTALF